MLQTFEKKWYIFLQISFLKNQFELKHLYYPLGCRKDKTPVSAKRISWSYNSWSYYVSKSKKPSYIFLSLMKSIFIPYVMLPGSWLERRNIRFIGIPKLLFYHRKKSKEIYLKGLYYRCFFVNPAIFYKKKFLQNTIIRRRRIKNSKQQKIVKFLFILLSFNIVKTKQLQWFTYNCSK